MTKPLADVFGQSDVVVIGMRHGDNDVDEVHLLAFEDNNI
jgi:hypothetical protein